MFGVTLPRAIKASSMPPSPLNNPYKAQRIWPPDFSKLDPKFQFRFERKYRRRSKLKWARPRWNKAVKLTSWGACSFVLVYGVLFMDWGNEKQPFNSVRSWLWDQTNSIWTTSSKNSPRATFDKVK